MHRRTIAIALLLAACSGRTVDRSEVVDTTLPNGVQALAGTDDMMTGDLMSDNMSAVDMMTDNIGMPAEPLDTMSDTMPPYSAASTYAPEMMATGDAPAPETGETSMIGNDTGDE